MFTSDPSHIKCHLLQLIERDCEMGAVKVFYLNLTAPAIPGFTPHSLSNLAFGLLLLLQHSYEDGLLA